MKPIFHVSVPAPLDRVQPLGDFVLVKRLTEEAGYIWIPDDSRNPDHGVRRGVVLACGPGDRLKSQFSPFPPFCRHDMNIKAGDEILYHRAPANDCVIDGEEYTFLHEEQHVLAVIEGAQRFEPVPMQHARPAKPVLADEALVQ